MGVLANEDVTTVSVFAIQITETGFISKQKPYNVVEKVGTKPLDLSSQFICICLTHLVVLLFCK